MTYTATQLYIMIPNTQNLYFIIFFAPLLLNKFD